MDLQNEKCVMVIDENLPLGIVAIQQPLWELHWERKCRKLSVVM